MKILFTGASSFTGFWFARELAAAGHEVVATFRRRPEEYPDSLRRRRVAGLQDCCRPWFGCSFGDQEFIDGIGRQQGWDMLCHHAAQVTDYKNSDFDVAAALQNNTRRLDDVLQALVTAGCGRIVLTGSVFENDEGAGSDELPAFSPYGLSKALTAQAFRHYAGRHGMRLGKFVIPNPFGPLEEPRFTTYLVKNWAAGSTPTVGTPDYVRDNIHVSLLAKSYAKFASELPSAPGFCKINPSGYAESQGAFARRFAQEIGRRLGIACPLELKRQEDFPEPRQRINTDAPDAVALGFNESAAWDELAAYYHSEFWH
jgi:UDP-glucose 4-epimerase